MGERVIGSIVLGITAAASVLAMGALGLELQYRGRAGNKLELTTGEWKLSLSDPTHYQLVGEMEFRNLTENLEIMLPEITARVKLLSEGSLDDISCRVKVIPCHQDAMPRADDYWFAYIVKLRGTTKIRVCVDITGRNLQELQAAWVKIRYVTYGPGGRIPKKSHVVLPLQYPDNSTPKARSVSVGEVFPIMTHWLCVGDDPVEVVR